MKDSLAVKDMSKGGFKAFPDFSRLTLADKHAYEKLIKAYPPIDDISFSSLVKWWNALDSGTVTTLNGNLVVSYFMPGLEDFSGIGLIGRKKVDESICEIFDYQKQNGERPRLVHVPEFVLSHISYPEMFNFKPMPEYDEYILNLDSYFPVGRAAEHMQKRVKKFIEQTVDDRVEVRQLDLQDRLNVQMLLEAAIDWPDEGTVNEIVRHSDDALQLAVKEAEALGTENLCLFVNGKLQAYILFTRPADRRYIIFSHAKVAYDMPYTYDYMVYAFSQWLTENGVSYVNLINDLGLPNLRRTKLALGPSGYFRKYTIEPAK